MDSEGRAFFKKYMDGLMACRQVSSNAGKNGHPFVAVLKEMLARAVTDLEVLELFALSLAYVAWDTGFAVEITQDLERAVTPDLPSLKGTWTMVDRVAQPEDDPDYPGFVVSVYRREKDGARDFLLVPKGTSSEDGPKAKAEERTRDQADKANRVSTGVEADGDPAGVAYHATKKYFKRVLLKRLRESFGATEQSKVIIAGHSLGGALTERLHLKMYDAGFKNVWSVAFSPPALDSRTISKALFRDDGLGPAAFERLMAIGGTWDAVTKGGNTGACIPLRVLAIRPWGPTAITPVPYSVAGSSFVDQRLLQHGVLYQHECKFAGWRLIQERRTLKDASGQLHDRVHEKTDDTYMVYEYCLDVTKWLAEKGRTPFGMELALGADASEKEIRKEFTVAPGSDRARAEKGSIAKYVKEIAIVSDKEALTDEDRREIEKELLPILAAARDWAALLPRAGRGRPGEEDRRGEVGERLHPEPRQARQEREGEEGGRRAGEARRRGAAGQRARQGRRPSRGEQGPAGVPRRSELDGREARGLIGGYTRGMQLIEQLREEHVLIERLAGSLRTFALSAARDPADAAAFLRFFRLWAGRFHHAREEEVLFPALVATEVPGDRGPLKVLLDAHHSMAAMLDAMEAGISPELAERYGRALLHHIDAENSVLFPESEIRMRGRAELSSRAPDAEEEAARAEGESLARKYPPSDFAGILRGEGCVACAAYGETCDGIEREWWSELEWEDALERMGNG